MYIQPQIPEWRDGRVVECDCLENSCPFTGTVGSNPSLSAIYYLTFFMPIYPSKKVKRARKTTNNIGKFIITLFNLVVFNYLIIYADKFQLAVENEPVKAAFTDVMPTASADINAQSIIFDNDDLDGNLTYIVRSGDTLETIAAELNTTVDNIKKVNKLKSNEIRPGQRLTVSQLPGIIITMQEDISLGDFIETYNLNEDDIKTLNNIADSRKIVRQG